MTCQAYPILCFHDSEHHLCNHYDMICTGDINIEEEAEEVSIIEVSNTVIDPRTMMVLRKVSLGSEN